MITFINFVFYIILILLIVAFGKVHTDAQELAKLKTEQLKNKEKSHTGLITFLFRCGRFYKSYSMSTVDVNGKDFVSAEDVHRVIRNIGWSMEDKIK